MSTRRRESGDPRGSDETRAFYDALGWVRRDGVLGDQALFGARGAGAGRAAAHRRRVERIRAVLREAGAPLRLLECGCGGNPAAELLDQCSAYTGVDFSRTGLAVAGEQLGGGATPFRLVQGDLCALPFADASFDAAYSAHALYHIDRPEAQAAAFREILRVVRPGGRAVFVLANPRPLLFPLRLALRLLADAPLLGALARRLRPAPPLPYRPMPLGWMRARLEPFGSVRVEAHAMASTWLNRHLPERGPGRAVWRILAWLEDAWPARAARLGNYVRLVVHKAGPPASDASSMLAEGVDSP